MTRINSGVKPQELSGKHLIAEHREIKRIPNLVKSRLPKIQNLPKNFCLGTGHVQFFYDKLGYLLDRYIQIRTECIRRGYNVTNYESAWDDVPLEYMGHWKETRNARQLILARIKEKTTVQ